MWAWTERWAGGAIEAQGHPRGTAGWFDDRHMRLVSTISASMHMHIGWHIGFARAGEVLLRPLRLVARRDFNSFVRACEKYGRENVAQIAAEVDGKTEEEVRAYAQVSGGRGGGAGLGGREERG